MSNLERRIERLEKEFGSTDERLIVILKRFAEEGEEGELTQMRCGETFIDRLPDENEAAFTQRAQDMAMRLSDPRAACVVVFETQRREHRTDAEGYGVLIDAVMPLAQTVPSGRGLEA
ncbi:MAG: hypothetical protein Q8S20_08330 [Sulfuritalea sp.]|nr:hypothetical protein [Sulfuritalea sp.]